MKNDIIENFRRLIFNFSFEEKYSGMHIKSIEDIKKIPFTRRLELEKWKPKCSPEKPVVFYEATGGRDGENFFMGINKKSHEFMIDRAVQALDLMEIRKGGNCLNLLFSDLLENAILKYGLTLMSLGDISNARTLNLAYAALKKLDITYLFACPNLLWDVLVRLGRNHSIEKCMVSGELFLPWFRKYIRESTDIAFYNWYGSSGGFIAAQDNPSDDFMQILDRGLYIEMVDREGRPLDMGRGFLVYTDLFNYSTPIIRYLLEDEVEIIKRGKKRYVRIIARAGDHLKLDGELVYKGFIIDEVYKILRHNRFIIVIDKTRDYQDLVNVFISKEDLKLKERILKFLKYLCVYQKIKILEQVTLEKLIKKKGNLIDLRREDINLLINSPTFN